MKNTRTKHTPEFKALLALARREIAEPARASVSTWASCARTPERVRFFTVPGRENWAVATSDAG